MSRTVAIIQARMTSTRLPGKVMLPLAGAPMLQRVVERALRIDGVDLVCVAIPDGVVHDPVADLLRPFPQIRVTRGPEQDVLRRYALAARETAASTVVRITSDCPLFDPDVSAAAIAAYRASGTNLARTALESGYPLGFDTEVVDAELLYEADVEARADDEREHVTAFFWSRPDRYPAVFVDRRPDRRHWRLTVDTQEDYELAAEIYRRLYSENSEFGFREIEALLTAEPELLQICAGPA